ncbi:NmrA family NAD(P)-binding protein [Luteimonas sp. S4-F44]|uniref:NmrA family NAD(P)-binding protein n=1 Tax=Luteimonas sp. S4-F44 TaxID=2925842 RepID=UPI001F537BAF|nr:NmrA family NAD(P)-binding protein [Luteimonas sp. S4-F44]UNK43903.1 NmrA family NAD(P)-binding protein [Luteimonas sp. S4-F44]
MSLIHRAHSIQLIAVEDIGKIVATLFADRARFAGMTLKIAGDRVTGDALEAAFSHAAGRPIPYARLPDAVLAAHPDLAHMPPAWNPAGSQSAYTLNGSARSIPSSSRCAHGWRATATHT